MDDLTTRAAVRLGRAVIVQALKDLRRGDRDAAAWLWSERGQLFIAAAGYDPERTADAIERVLDGAPLRRA